MPSKPAEKIYESVDTMFQQKSSDFHGQPWFAGDCNREEAEAKLAPLVGEFLDKTGSEPKAMAWPRLEASVRACPPYHCAVSALDGSYLIRSSQSRKGFSLTVKFRSVFPCTCQSPASLLLQRASTYCHQGEVWPIWLFG